MDYLQNFLLCFATTITDTATSTTAADIVLLLLLLPPPPPPLLVVITICNLIFTQFSYLLDVQRHALTLLTVEVDSDKFENITEIHFI
jgi:hypothetical protein